MLLGKIICYSEKNFSELNNNFLLIIKINQYNICPCLINFFLKQSVTVHTGLEICPKGCSAIVDSGSSAIYGPALEINELNSKLGFAEDGSIDCSAINNLPSKFIVSKNDFFQSLTYKF